MEIVARDADTSSPVSLLVLPLQRTEGQSPLPMRIARVKPCTEVN
ncbi:hypothetical protein ASZ90_010765 [hydrocarbon metagenome]|uniref:Uncharacterized protein n=1 Tax=hydrocarbon metagenome TaxID=938273 RepID=A0A0W8FF82_9ZZZZ